MARKIKESHPLSIRMEKDIYECLDQFCKDSGLSKTVAIERAVEMYIADYRHKEKLINKSINK